MGIKKAMNHKPGSVWNRPWAAPSAICLGPALRTASGGTPGNLPALDQWAIGTKARAFVAPLDFAPDEACQANAVTGIAGGSYPAGSPLWEGPRPFFTVCFLLRCLSGKGISSRGKPQSDPYFPPGCYPASCPAEPGLSSNGVHAPARGAFLMPPRLNGSSLKFRVCLSLAKSSA